MRRVLGLTAAGLAVVFAAFAVILGGHASDPAAGSRLSERATVTLVAAGASYLSPVRLTEVTGASIQVTDTIRGTAEPGFPQIAVWSVVSSVYDTTHRQPLEPASRTLAFDAATAELVSCCNANINGSAGIQQTGIAGWAFPRGTRKQTYDVFDIALHEPEPFAYSGTGTVDGIQAYQFTEHIAAAPAGSSPLSRAGPERYSMQSTYWVDPQTGALLQISENEDLYIVNAATGATVTHLFDADLSTTPSTVASLVSQDTRARDAGPAAARGRLLFRGLAALAAVAGALLLLGPGGRAGPRHSRGPDTDPREPAARLRAQLFEADR
jgi:hypothetical protein